MDAVNNEKNKRILIIDDNEAIHDDFRMILASKTLDTSTLDAAEAAILGGTFDRKEHDTFEVDSAFQGQEGLEKIQRALQEGRPYAMAFVDVRMPPGWDGIETIQRIWKEYSDLQVVICTAYSDYEWHEIVKKLGRTEKLLILKKPFEKEEVYQLAIALTEKWYLSMQARFKHKELERIVKLRTRELEEANKELTAALEAAERADKAKTEFLANMSHEIRTPMNSVIGFSEVLAQEDLTDEQKKYVNLIWRSGKNLMRIINDILDFSKIEAGKLEMDMVECAISQILADVDEMLRPCAQSKGLEFRILQSGQLPLKICTDPERLHQCLINLVSNAIKFTDKGYVNIRVKMEHCRDKTPCIHFDIEDSGIGIEPRDHERIFESFTQADGSARRKYGGTGLGLAISGHLARLLGGELTVQSVPGKGSTFSLAIPAGHDPETLQSLNVEYNTRRIDKNNGQKKDVECNTLSGKVLVAEDVETNQILTKTLLSRMGLDVTIAADGHEAVKRALDQEYDLIFMDIQMPGMDGFEATKELRRKGLTTPILALTAHAMKGDEQKCIEAGCNGYLSKPLDRLQLMEKVCQYLSTANDSRDEKTKPITSGIEELANHFSDPVLQESDVNRESESSKTKEIMNWDRLIGRLGDEELIREVVPIFLKDNKERLEKLAEAINAGDADSVKLYAHAIKGAGRNVGAQSLADIAYDLECAGQDSDMDTFEALFDAVEAELKKVVTFLSRPDWMDVAKQKKVITDDVLNASTASG